MQPAIRDLSRDRAIWAFGAASLITIGLGAVVMAQAGLPPGLWIRNLIAWLVAAGLGLFAASRGWLRFPITFAALAIIVFSIFGPGQEGVHRWVAAGPVQLNAAALVLPVAIAAFTRERAGITAACFIAIAGVIALQPDISQLAGFAIAGMILFTRAFGWKGALVSAAASGLLIAYCLMQPDPLLPVPHVEGIFQLAWSQSVALSMAMAATLAATALAPLLFWPVVDLRWKALALSGYFVGISLAPVFGAFPVPLAGYGLSFVVGWVLGFTALALRRNASDRTRGP